MTKDFCCESSDLQWKALGKEKDKTKLDMDVLRDKYKSTQIKLERNYVPVRR